RPGDRNNSKLQCWTLIGGKNLPVYAWDLVPAIESSKLVFRTSHEYGSKTLDTAKAEAATTALLKLGFYTHEHRAYWTNNLLRQRPHVTSRVAIRFPEIIV